MGAFIFISGHLSLLAAFVFIGGHLHLWVFVLLAGVHVHGHCLHSWTIVFVGCWYGVEVGHSWLVVVCPCGHLHHCVVVVAIFTIHPVMWHCHIAAVVVCVCHGGCGC